MDNAGGSLLSRYFKGLRPLPAEVDHRLDAVLALGEPDEPGDGASRPAFVLGELNRAGDWAPWVDEKRRLGAFAWEDRELAVETARFLRATALTDAFAAPCRHSWLDRNCSEGREVLWLSQREQGDRAGGAALNVLNFVASVLHQGDFNAGLTVEET